MGPGFESLRPYLDNKQVRGRSDRTMANPKIVLKWKCEGCGKILIEGQDRFYIFEMSESGIIRLCPECTNANVTKRDV